MVVNAKENRHSAPLLLIHHQEQLAGIQMRNQDLSGDTLEEVAALYKDGWSPPGVAEQFGCNVESVRTEFRASGCKRHLHVAHPWVNKRFPR